MQIDGFDWDDGNLAKCRKHGVSVEEIEELFVSGAVLILPDTQHSLAEERSKAIGKTSAGRWIFLAFTLRQREGSHLLRPVSVRYMHRKEVDYYEKDNSTAPER